MKYLRSPFHLCLSFLICCLMSGGTLAVLAQSDLKRETVAVTYPLDQSVTLNFRGTTRLPRLSGEAKVKRSGRRNTRVEMEIKNLPRAFELGGVYTTFVLWAISPEGHADNLGEIKRGGSFIVNTKIDVTTTLQTFALIVTAEPHFLVTTPSRMVVLENLPPRNPGDAEVATVAVKYLGNSSDYFNDSRVPDMADRDYARTPTSLLGARQAVNLARYAGAERDAENELKAATEQLDKAENAWRLNGVEAEVDSAARTATSLAVKAEESAQERAAARKRRDETARRDAAVREAENSAATATQQIQEMRERLRNEEHARELAERDAANSNQQLRDLRNEVASLRDELQAARAASEDAKVQLARIEGERSAEQARLAAEQTRAADEQRVARLREAASALRLSLARFGTVKETARGLVLILPDSVWNGARAADLTPKAAATTIDPLAALLSNNPDFNVIIEAYADSRGEEASLQKLTQDRAEALAGRLVSAGLDGTRIQANGMGASNPLGANTTPAGRLRNRRIEVTLVPSTSSATTTAQGNRQD